MRRGRASPPRLGVLAGAGGGGRGILLASQELPKAGAACRRFPGASAGTGTAQPLVQVSEQGDKILLQQGIWEVGMSRREMALKLVSPLKIKTNVSLFNHRK